jgi:hypothetical protein
MFSDDSILISKLNLYYLYPEILVKMYGYFIKFLKNSNIIGFNYKNIQKNL